MALLNAKKTRTVGAATLMIAMAVIAMAPMLADDSDAASPSTTSYLYALKNGETVEVYGLYENGATMGDYTFQLPAGFSQAGTFLDQYVRITCGPEVSAGEYTVTMKRTVDGTEYTRSHTVYVNQYCTTLFHSDTTYHTGKVGENLTVQIYDGDGMEIAVDSVTKTGGIIPSGTSISHDYESFTISGSPTAKGLYVATFEVNLSSMDGEGTATHTVVIDVDSSASFTVSDISVYSGQNISKTVCTEPLTSVTGAPWLHFTGGTIYGTAPSPGTYNVTVYSGSASASFAITVVSALHPTNSPTAGLLTFEI